MKARNQNLDAIRGIAILMVLGRHFEYFSLWKKVGWAGVDVFFVLSGFLISGLLFEEWKRTGQINIARFYIRRGFKIYPSFYTMIAATVFAKLALSQYLAPNPFTWKSLASEFFFLQSYIAGLWGHTWSLAVEEHFYLLLPLVLVFMSTRRRPSEAFKEIPTVFFAVAIIELLCRIWFGWRHFDGDYLSYLFPSHLRMDGMFFGVLLGYYHHFQPATFERIAASRGAIAVIILAVALLLWLPIEHPLMHTFGCTFVFLGAGLFLAKTVDAKPGRAVELVLKPIAIIGSYSYSIYLWHLAVARLMSKGGIGIFIASLIAAIGFGMLMAKILERPALNFRDRVFPKTSGTAEIVVVEPAAFGTA